MNIQDWVTWYLAGGVSYVSVIMWMWRKDLYWRQAPMFMGLALAWPVVIVVVVVMSVWWCYRETWHR